MRKVSEGHQAIVIAFGVLLVFFLAHLFAPNAIGFVVPALLLFVPLLIIPPIREPAGFIQVLLSSLVLDRNWGQLGQSLRQFVLWVLIVFPPYLVCAHFWMLYVFGYQGFAPAPFNIFVQTLATQVFWIAFPEEFFFRGYLQPALNKIWQPRWRFFGANLGWGLIVTSLIFAFAHSVIQLKWWHFSIFFPSLLFGYLRERCGSITAPILFHAFSNSFMNWFVTSYLKFGSG